MIHRTIAFILLNRINYVANIRFILKKQMVVSKKIRIDAKNYSYGYYGIFGSFRTQMTQIYAKNRGCEGAGRVR